MKAESLRLLSGVKPTGRPHIGNYFGAMKQFVDLQETHQSFIMIADYHALTANPEPAVLRHDTLNVAIDYLAIGLDPQKVIIFRQSDVAAHTELAWIFNCLTTVPYLMRAHAYKDAVAKGEEVNVGTFDYPLLMAADILLYDAAVVPVGQDQKQHLEIARDTGEKFNRVYGETFRLPEPLIMPEVNVVPGLDGRKMSKSYGNTIPLFAPPAELKSLVMSIVTDSRGESEPKDPETCNVFTLHKLFNPGGVGELAERYRAGTIGYRQSKEILFEQLNKFIEPLRARRQAMASREGEVKAILERGGEAARALADQKIKTVRQRIGLLTN